MSVKQESVVDGYSQTRSDKISFWYMLLVS